MAQAPKGGQSLRCSLAPQRLAKHHCAANVVDVCIYLNRAFSSSPTSAEAQKMANAYSAPAKNRHVTAGRCHKKARTRPTVFATNDLPARSAPEAQPDIDRVNVRSARQTSIVASGQRYTPARMRTPSAVGLKDAAWQNIPSFHGPQPTLQAGPSLTEHSE